jgi:hypothetical protein
MTGLKRFSAELQSLQSNSLIEKTRAGLSLSDEASSGWENLKMSQAQFCSCRSMMLLLFTGQAIVVDGGQYRIG